MTVNVQYVKMPNSEAMTEFVTEKLEKLGDKYNSIINADVFFKQENDAAGKGKICDIKIHVPGSIFFASSKETSFEQAVSSSLSELRKQLEKHKTLQQPY